MRIHSISIQNIQSLGGSTHINFDHPEFQKNPLFAITGNTGSGKSTILDCICLALYGETPRVKNFTESNLLDGILVTRGVDNAYVELIYSALGTYYKAVRTYRQRRGGKSWEFKTEFAIQNSLGVWETKEDSDKKKPFDQYVLNSVGLSFEQFTKTVLLAQGEFKKLLAANATERAEIIETLTSTQHFRKIGTQVYEKRKSIDLNIDQKISDLNAKEEDGLTVEQKDNMQAEMEQLSVDLAKFQSDYQQNEQYILQIQQLESLAKLQQKVIDIQTQITESEKIVETARKALDADQKASSYQVDIAQKTDLKNRIEEGRNQLFNTKHKLDALTEKKNSLFLEYSEQFKLPINKEQEFLSNVESKFSELLKIETDLESETRIINQAKNSIRKIQSDLDNRNKLYLERKENKQKAEEKLQIAISLIQRLGQIEHVKPYLSKLFAHLEERNRLRPEIGLSKSKDLFTTVSNQEIKQIQDSVNEIKGKIHDNSKQLEKLGLDHSIHVKDELKKLRLEQDKLLQAEISGKELEGLKKKKKSYVQKVEIGQKEANRLTEVKKNIAIEIVQLEENIQTLGKQEFNMDTSQLIESLRNELVEHENCPVCGSIEHPFLEKQELKEQFLRNQINKLEIKENLSKLNAELNSTNNELTKYTANISSLKEQIQEIESSILKCKVELEKLSCSSLQEIQELQEVNNKKQSQFETIELLNEKSLKFNQELQTAVQNQSVLKSLIAEEESIHTILKPLIPSLNNSSTYENLESMCTEFDSAQNEKQLLLFTIPELDSAIQIIKDELENDNEELKVFNETLDKASKKKALFQAELSKYQISQPIRIIRDEFNQKLKELDSGIFGESKAIEQIHHSLSQSEEKLLKVEELIQKKLSHDSVFQSIEEVLKAILSLDKKRELNKMLDEQNNRKGILKEREEEYFQAQQDSKDISSSILEEKTLILKKKIDLENIIEKNKKELQSRELKLSEQKRRELKHQELREEIEKLEQDARVIRKLSDLIGSANGDKFAKYAAVFTTQRLLEWANVHLQKLKSRYRLHLDMEDDPQKAEILVKDLDMDGEVRPASKTLSGGESFQVSLCLALGLSDLSSNRVRVESLFIDEGFGSLDQDSLQEAFLILQSLQGSSQKMVGVISHVESLKNQIATQISVEKVASGLSKVRLPY